MFLQSLPIYRSKQNSVLKLIVTNSFSKLMYDFYTATPSQVARNKLNSVSGYNRNLTDVELASTKLIIEGSTKDENKP
jgi:hypothetical protein